MKPDFALDLSQDGLALLCRAGDGWARLGSVSFDDPDLKDRVAELRARAETRAAGSMRTKLILPESQILYAEVDAPGPDDDSRRRQIEAALDGRTPYAVDDLAYDWVLSGKKVLVAVIARLTLAEAEAFAEAQGFNPVSFVAAPDAGKFVGEPFFGATSRAADHMPVGAKVERDRESVRIVDLPREATGAIGDAISETEPTDRAEAVRDGKNSSESNIEANTAATEPEPGPAVAESAGESPCHGDIAGGGADEAPFIAIEDDGPADAGADGTTDAAADETAAAFASRRTSATRSAEPSRAVDAPGRLHLLADRPEPPRPAAARGSALDIGITAPELAVPAGTETPGDDASAGGRRQRVLGRAVRSPLPEARHGTQAQQRERRASGGDDYSRTAGILGAASRIPYAESGNRRRLGLLLVAILVLLMGAVAVWSLWFADGPAPRSALPPMTDSASLPAAPDPAETNTVADVATAPAADPAPQTAPDASQLFAVAPDEPAGTPSAGAAATDASPEGPPDSVSAAIAEAMAPTQSDAPSASVPPADATAAGAEDPALAPPAAPWTAAPAAVPLPPAETSGAAMLAATDAAAPALPVPPGTLPEWDTSATDSDPTWQPTPPPFGTVISFGQDGRIVATPEGVVTPDGYALFAGQPPVVPAAAPRPDATPAAPPDGLPPAAADPAPDALPAPVDPSHAAVQPRPRPATALDAAEAPPAEPPGTVPPDTPVPAPVSVAADTPLPPPVDPAHAAMVPRQRPEEIVRQAEVARARAAAIAAAAEAAARAEAEALANASRLAVATSRRPSGRPSNLAKAVEAAVAAAVVATPEPAPPPQPAPAPAAEPEEIDEPEPTQAVPNIPTTVTVAKQATIKNAINLSKINLIGVYGSSANRRALVRMPTGRLLKVKIGDRLDGGQVAAIGDSELTYVKGGRSYTLKIQNSG